MLRVVLELLLILFMARALWRVIEGVIQGVAGRENAIPQRGTQMVRDPVCGTFVLPDRAVTLLDGRSRLFFCSEACRDKYRARPSTGSICVRFAMESAADHEASSSTPSIRRPVPVDKRTDGRAAARPSVGCCAATPTVNDKNVRTTSDAAERYEIIGEK